MNKTTALLAAITLVAVCSAVHALATGGPGGKWPASWPKEMEPLRKQAWTWEHEFSQFYDIPFTDRDQFEAAWPHILTLQGKGAPLTLMRGPHLRVEVGKTAGVQIYPAAKWVKEGPASLTRLVLVVDGKIVDLNRIPLPADTPIIDERFKGADEKGAEKGAPQPAAGEGAAAPKR